MLRAAGRRRARRPSGPADPERPLTPFAAGALAPKWLLLGAGRIPQWRSGRSPAIRDPCSQTFSDRPSYPSRRPSSSVSDLPQQVPLPRHHVTHCLLRSMASPPHPPADNLGSSMRGRRFLSISAREALRTDRQGYRTRSPGKGRRCGDPELRAGGPAEL